MLNLLRLVFAPKLNLLRLSFAPMFFVALVAPLFISTFNIYTPSLVRSSAYKCVRDRLKNFPSQAKEKENKKKQTASCVTAIVCYRNGLSPTATVAPSQPYVTIWWITFSFHPRLVRHTSIIVLLCR